VKKIIAINLFIVLIIILLLEFGIRFFNLVGMQGFEKEAFLKENGITFSKPNRSFKVFGKNSKTDQFGFRIPLRDFSYDNSKKFTLILGDSVTFGVGVEEKDTFVGILREKLNKNNLLNTAIFGHNIESYFYILKKNQKKFNDSIDKVIIFICLNDVVPYQGVVSKEDLNKNKITNENESKIFQNNIAIQVNLFLRERSAIFVLVKSLFTRPVERHYNIMRDLYNNKKNLLEFKNNLSQIVEYSFDNKLPIEFILLPYAHQINNNCREDLLFPQNELIKIFNGLNLKLYNYTNKFCKMPDKNNLFLKYDPVHLSKHGHMRVSDLLIADKILN
tara:strand:- start:3082 stop:4077 length:996 start_codon:yes stop_codon:yes gene_type:complete